MLREETKFFAGNGENFSLEEFIATEGATLIERVKPFSDYFRSLAQTGHLLYSREIVGPSENCVQVRDTERNTVREMVMLGSNNYLGLTTHPKVIEAVKKAVDRYGVGMGGPPLLNGMSSLHRQLEKRLAKLKGGDDAMLFGSGFQANLGWVSALMRKGDVLLFDELNHASLYDGIALAGNKCRAFRFRHNDCSHLKALLERFANSKNHKNHKNHMNLADQRKSLIFVAVEGVYSMDGDVAPLGEIAQLCRDYGAYLMVDDAHGTGVIGPKGAGTTELFQVNGQVDIFMGTFSKAFGTTGGFLIGKQEVIDYLRLFCRSYMFSAHLPPTTVMTVLAGLDVIEEEPELLRRLEENTQYLYHGLKSLGYQVKRGGAIIPLLVPEKVNIRELNRRIHGEGVFVNSIEYPAVGRGEQRLRLSVMATHTRDNLDYVISVFKKMRSEFEWP